jgi:hypothetical protein
MGSNKKPSKTLKKRLATTKSTKARTHQKKAIVEASKKKKLKSEGDEVHLQDSKTVNGKRIPRYIQKEEEENKLLRKTA